MKPNIRPIKKPTYAKRNRETILPSRLALILNDAIAIIIFAVCVMLAIALFTHSINDNCWSKTVNVNIVHNKLGTIGAYISDILFYILGFSAWWLVLGGFYLGYNKINRRKIQVGSLFNIARILGFCVLVIASSSFEYIMMYHQPSTLPDGFGGGGVLLFLIMDVIL